MTRVLVLLAALALAGCQPGVRPLPPEQQDIINTGRLIRVCPDGYSRVYVTTMGARYLYVAGLRPSLTQIDPTANLKDIC